MQSFEFTPQGVCARKITFDLEEGLIHHLHFEGGCPGNLAAIGKLLEGRSAKEAADILLGNTCRGKQTSCADQLAHALIEAMERGIRKERAVLIEAPLFDALGCD